VNERTGFRILTALSFATAAALLYLLIVEWTGDWRRAVGGVAVFLGATSVADVRDPFLLDALSFCFIVGGLYLAARRRWWWLIPLLVAAVFARDAIVVLLAPALVAYAVRSREARLPLALAGVACLVAWFLLNETSLVLGFDPPQYNNFARATLDSVLDYERKLGPLPKVAYRAVLFSFGALWLAPVLARRALRQHPWALAAAGSGIVAVLLAPFVADWPRALTYAFPLIIASVVLLPRANRLRATFAFALCLAVANYWAQYTGGGAARYGLEFGLLAVEGALLFALVRPAAKVAVDGP
jgi:hypothetical protein